MAPGVAGCDGALCPNTVAKGLSLTSDVWSKPAAFLVCNSLESSWMMISISQYTKPATASGAT